MSKITSIEHCHNCSRNMKITLDLSLNGNHVIECPHCKHEHCRVIENGKVTSDRWGSRNVPTYYATVSYYVSDLAGCSTAGSSFLQDSWLITTSCT